MQCSKWNVVVTGGEHGGGGDSSACASLYSALHAITTVLIGQGSRTSQLSMTHVLAVAEVLPVAQQAIDVAIQGWKMPASFCDSQLLH